jgi:hypothetical protein
VGQDRGTSPRLFCDDIGTNLHVLSASLRSGLALQSKLSLASICPSGHKSIMVLPITVFGRLISGTDFCLQHPVNLLL